MTITVYQRCVVVLTGTSPIDDAWIWTTEHPGSLCVAAAVPDRVVRWGLGEQLGELKDAEGFAELTGQVDPEVIPILRGAARRLGLA